MTATQTETKTKADSQLEKQRMDDEGGANNTSYMDGGSNPPLEDKKAEKKS